MNEVEKVIEICKERDIPITRLEKDCGFSNKYITNLKRGTFPYDRLVKIAEYLNVPLSSLSDAAADTSLNYYIANDSDNRQILIESYFYDVLSGPYRDKLCAYAKKLYELQMMESE